MEACLELYKQLGGLNRYQLRCILAGALTTQSRIFRINKDEGNVCPCCQEAVETTGHVMDECPAHTPQRLTEISQEKWSALPECLRHHGLMPANYEAEGDGTPAENRKCLAVLVQHNLLDIWQNRQKIAPGLQLQPRWESRNVRPRLEEVARGNGANTRGREATEDATRNVRPKLGAPGFTRGGNLVTGANWREA